MYLLHDCLYDLIGTIGRIHWGNIAEIHFILNGKRETAILDKRDFWHDGRRIPAEDELEIYVQPGVAVKFSCKYVESKAASLYSWTVHTCCTLEPLSFTRGKRISGILARISSLNGQEGTIAFADERNIETEAYFAASVVQINGKPFDQSQSLSNLVTIGGKVRLDVIPCIVTENPAGAEYIAVKVVIGENLLAVTPLPVPALRDNLADIFIMREMHKLLHGKFTTYIRGKGTVAKMLNDQVGLIQGETAIDFVEPIIFHQGSSSLYEFCLPNAPKETHFKAGDNVNFLAVKTPYRGVVDWMAVQITPYNVEEDGPLPLCTKLYISRKTAEFLLFFVT